EPGHH
ncbi:hypothetical protein S40285_10815, partial [Stachybotrys chlorohalonatus IBT 40285]